MREQEEESEAKHGQEYAEMQSLVHTLMGDLQAFKREHGVVSENIRESIVKYHGELCQAFDIKAPQMVTGMGSKQKKGGSRA